MAASRTRNYAYCKRVEGKTPAALAPHAHVHILLLLGLVTTLITREWKTGCLQLWCRVCKCVTFLRLGLATTLVAREWRAGRLQPWRRKRKCISFLPLGFVDTQVASK